MRLASLILFGTLLFASQADAAFFGRFGDSTENAVAKDGVITLDVSGLDKMKARHYRYREDGKAVKFFVVRDGEGVVRAALDACDVCWEAGKGYVLKGGAMLCVNCGLSFPMRRIGLAAGGCNPHPFQYKVENGSVVLTTEELLREGTQYFSEGKR